MSERENEWTNDVLDHLTKLLVKRITHRSFSSNIQAERKLINLLGMHGLSNNSNIDNKAVTP